MKQIEEERWKKIIEKDAKLKEILERLVGAWFEDARYCHAIIRDELQPMLKNWEKP